MTWLAEIRRRENVPAAYNDFELATALHERYQAETGAQVPFEAFAAEVGLSRAWLAPSSIPPDAQPTDPAGFTRPALEADRARMTHGAPASDRPQPGPAPSAEQVLEASSSLPGAMQRHPGPSMLDHFGFKLQERARTAAGELVEGVGDIIAGIPQGIATLRESNRRRLEEALAVPEEDRRREDPRETDLFRAGESIKQFADDLIRENPVYEQEFLTGKVPRALGSAVAFLLSSVLTRGALRGAPGSTVAGAAVPGALAGAAGGFEDALLSGASLEEALAGSDIMGMVGLSEAVPIVRILDRLDRGSGGLVRRAIANAVKGGTEEAVQESFQQIMQAMTAQKWVGYDPERRLLTDLDEAAGVGFTVGGLLGFLTTLVGGRRSQQVGRVGREWARNIEGAEIDPALAEETARAAMSPEGAQYTATAEIPGIGENVQTEGTATAAAPDGLVAQQRPPAPASSPQFRAAIDRLMSDRGGEVNSALRHPDVGDIDLVWGEPGSPGRSFHDGYGLSHIIAKHPEFDLYALEGIIQQARPTKRTANRVHMETPDHRVVIRLDWDGQARNWLLTAFEMDPARAAERTGGGGTLKSEPLSDQEAGLDSSVDEGPVRSQAPARMIDQIRSRERIPPGYTDQEVATAIHELYEAETGAKGDFAETARALGLPEDVVAQGPVQMPGAQHVSFIRDQANEAAPRRGRPIRREDILRPFLKALGVPLYQGRVKGRGMERVLGYYLPGKEAVRNRKMNDLETAAHELAHLIDDRAFYGWRGKGENRPASTRPWLPGKHPQWQTFSRELKDVSYDETKVYEGFAEFVRLWMTQPEVLPSRTPAFLKWWEEEFVAKHKYGPALKRAQAGMREWYAQSATDRARSKIGGKPSEKILTDVEAGLWDRFRQSLTDDLHGLWMMETSVRDVRAPESLGPYETARLMRAAYSIVDGALRFGPPRRNHAGHWTFSDRDGNPSALYRDGRIVANPNFKPWGLDAVLAPVSRELDDWILYAVGRSASELLGQNREKLFTKTEIEGMLALGDGKPHFAQVFADYQRWNNAILDFAQSLGLLSAEQRASWRRSEYLPFYRVGQAGATTRRQGIEGNVQVTHMLTGGTGNLRDILGNMVQNASRLIVEAIKNDARLKVVDFANRERGAGRFLVKIAKDAAPVKIDKRQVEDAVIEAVTGVKAAQYRRLQKVGQGIPQLDAVLGVMDANAQSMLQFWMFGQAPRGDNVIAVRRNGETEFYEVADPLVYRALASFNRQGPQQLIVRGLDAVRRLGQTSITLSIDFMTANLWRDTLHGWAFSKHGFRPVIDSLIGMRSRALNDPAYREFIANGGGMASYLVDEQAFERHVRSFYQAKGIDWRFVLNTPRKLLLGLELMAETFEMATRLGEYKRAIQKGASPREAAYAGREVSVDFAMRGDSELANLAFRSILFLKAAINGLDRAWRGGFKDMNRRDIWLRSGMVAAISVVLYLLVRGNPDYEDQEDWDKDLHWHVLLYRREDGLLTFKRPPGATGPLFHLRFPKIWEIGAIASGAERTMGSFLDLIEKGYADGGKYASRVGHIFLDLFKLEYIPQALEPLYEVYSLNRNRFSGREIETPDIEMLEPFARAKPSTSRTMEALAELTADLPPELQFSPAKAEALFRGYFNTWGMYGLMLSDEVFFGDQLPAWRTDQLPGIRRFTRDHPLRGTVHEKEFWELYREAAMMHKTMKEMVERDRPELAERRAEIPETAFFPLLESVRQRSGEINKAMLAVRDDATLSRQEKREQIAALQAEKNAFFKEVMEQATAERVAGRREANITNASAP